jgi:hypothetical protein
LLVTIVLVLIEIFFNHLFFFFKITHESNLPFILPTSHFDVALYVFIRIVKACILAPIIETFIFQYLMFEILSVKFRLRKEIFIFISAVLFGLSHYTSYTTVIVTSVLCVVLNYFYVVLIELNCKNRAFLIIALIHSSLNACVFLDQYYELYFNR